MSGLPHGLGLLKDGLFAYELLITEARIMFSELSLVYQGNVYN